MRRLSLSATLCAALVGLAGCVDDVEQVTADSPAKASVKQKAMADARLKQGALPSGELKEFDPDAGAKKKVEEVQPVPTSIAEPISQPDPNALLRGWSGAKVGDYVVVECSALARMYGNSVVRTATVRLEVVAQDDTSVVLRARGKGVEKHDSERKEVKRKHWELPFEGAGELILSRAPDSKLGTPRPPPNLSAPQKKTLIKIPVQCSQRQLRDEVRERCVAENPAELYLTAGLVQETVPARGDGCRLLEVGNSPPSKRAPSDLSATDYVFVERYNGHFRDRVVLAAGGVVKVEQQRLTYLRKAQPGSVAFNKKNYRPDVVDTRRMQALDWALTRVMPEFPAMLPLD